MEEKNISRSRKLAARLLHAALSILSENGKQLASGDLTRRVEARVELDSWAKEIYAKTGYVRWEALLHLFSIDCVKAGYIIKKKRIWYLTPEGEAALKLSPDEFMEKAWQAYKKWRRENPIEHDDDEVPEEHIANLASYDEMQQKAMDGLQEYINAKNAYEFQDLVAALLRGMGYYTPFVAPKGKDGGVDIIAYRDPLGTQSPRIQVQIKHQEAKTGGPEVQQLKGLLQKDGNVGMFVSSSGFTPDAKNQARGSNVHVELVDLDRFIELWQEFYDKMEEEDKALMPLRPIFFLALGE